MKMRTAALLALLPGAILLAGCGGGKAAARGSQAPRGTQGTAAAPQGPSPEQMKAIAAYTGAYPFEKEAVRIHLKADARLNLFEAAPHALLICVYHLRDPNGFNQVLDEPDGIGKILDCSRFDPGVANTKKIFIQPGEEITERLDRPEGAKYVGIVAGYSTLKKDSSVRLYPVPIVEERIGWSIRKTAMPGKLSVDLYLGPDALQDVRGRR